MAVPRVAPIPDKPILIIDTPTPMVVAADLHIGVEDEYRKAGAFFQVDYEMMAHDLCSCIPDTHLHRLVIVGDLKHSTLGPTNREQTWVPKVLERLSTCYSHVDILIGNHDGSLRSIIEPLPDNVSIHGVHGAVIDGVALIHGNAWPNDRLYEAELMVMAHNHPHLWLARKVGRPLYLPCWFKAPFVKEGAIIKQVIVMPAYTTKGNGAPVNGPPKELRGPVLTHGYAKIEEAGIRLLDGTDMGTVAQLRHQFPTDKER
jgi:hypothetical protein